MVSVIISLYFHYIFKIVIFISIGVMMKKLILPFIFLHDTALVRSMECEMKRAKLTRRNAQMPRAPGIVLYPK